MFQHETTWTSTKSKWTTGVKKFREKSKVFAAHAKDVAGWLGYEIEHAPRSFARWKEQKVMRSRINAAADHLTRMDAAIRREKGISLDEFDRKNSKYIYVGDYTGPFMNGPAPQMLEPTEDYAVEKPQ